MTGSDPRSPADGADSTWLRPGALLAIAFLVLVVIAGAGVIVATGEDSGGPPVATPGVAPQQGSSAADPSLSGRSSAAGVPPLRPLEPSGEVPVPVAAPAGVRWELYATVALPYSQSAGPSRVDGDVAAGYAHTPVGALLAARQIPVRKLLAADWRAVVEASIAPGPGREAWVALRARYGQLGPPQPGQLGQTAAFRFVDYSRGRAVIQVVSRFATGKLQVTTATVAWSGQDWQLVLQPDGSDTPTGQVVTSLAGFVAWGGI